MYSAVENLIYVWLKSTGAVTAQLLLSAPQS